MQLKFPNYKKKTTRLRKIDILRKIIEIYGISAEDIKAYIIFKTDNIYVLWTKNFKDRLYKVNLYSEEIFNNFRSI